MKEKRQSMLIILLLFLTLGAKAQDGFNIHVQAKTMHYWRGLKVTDGLMTGTSVGYFSDHFSLYGWGGLSIDGSYTEVTGIAKYTNKNYSLTLVDIDNFSGLSKIDYFNYKAKETNHIVDLTAAYQFPFMSFSWSTVLYGNDRIAGTSTQRYSTYVEIDVPVKLNDSAVTFFIAPAFTLNSDAETMLYGDDERFGIANTGIKVNRTLVVGKYNFPVSAELGFNAALNQASIQLAIDLF